MWNFVKKEFWPIKGANYFLENILLNEKIAEDKRNGYFMYLIFVFLILSLILSVVQYFYHDHRTFMLLTFDYFGLNNFPLNIKISKAIINISTFCFYKFMYFDLGKTKYFPQFKNVFIENNRAFVLGSRTKFMKWIVWNLRFYQVLVVALELWLIGIYIQFGLALSVHTFGSIYRWCLAYLCMSIFFVIFSATFSIFCVGGFAGGVALSTIFVIFERVKIGSSRYLHQPVSRFTTARLLRYRRENVQTLDHLFGFSSHYGNLLVTFLWTNIPSNVSFIAILLLGNEFSVFVYFFCIVAVIGQITVLIFFHLVAALVINRIHRPYQVFHSQFVRSKSTSLVSRIRLGNNIEAFLARKRYGISYNMLGKGFSLVSMAAFFKFILFYGEMILYGYAIYLQSNSNQIITN